MGGKNKKYWSVPLACVFAFWGAFLNLATSSWLLRWHYGNGWHSFDSPEVPMLFGFFLGIITSAAFVYQNAVLALRSGLVFLFLAALFSSFGLRFEIPLLARLDIYGLCFVWALSLIAIGTILRSPKKRVN